MIYFYQTLVNKTDFPSILCFCNVQTPSKVLSQIQTHFNQFCCNDLDFDDELGTDCWLKSDSIMINFDSQAQVNLITEA